jgi:hypothetical protein|tara:strand:- start:4096 stop:4923 length:828 start_codon:yes stop_codon:yes gene_type:complete
MAKKAKAEAVEVAPQEVVVKPTPVKEKPKTVNQWEIKPRTYLVKGRKQPLTLTIPGKHTRKNPLLFFDRDKNAQRELRYATNMNSPFVDEQKGEATLGHITFRDGVLTVPEENQILQKLLSLYHPLKDKKYYEFDSVEEAEDELDFIHLEIEALNAATNMDVDQAEAILRVEKGSAVSGMKSKEIKRDLLLFAKRKPGLFLNLANDENVELRNFGIKAVEARIINLSQDQRTFHWGSNDRKLFTVPFDENPYSALAAWFKTDEGVEVYKSIEKRL